MWFVLCSLAFGAPLSKQEVVDVLRTSSSNWETKVEELLRDQVTELASRRVHDPSRALALDSEQFTDLLESYAKGIKKSQSDKVRALTVGRTAQGLLDEWLGFDSSVRFMTDEPTVPVESVYEDQVSASSSLMGLAVESVQVTKDIGQDGHLNGRVERGEWVQIRVKVKAKPGSALFSTSSWRGKQSSGLMVKQDRIVWNELSDQDAAQFLSFWVYVGGKASYEESLTFNVGDSWIRDGEPASLVVKIRPENIPGFGMPRIRSIDQDDLGFSSDGSGGNGVGPGARFELTADGPVAAQANRVYQVMSLDGSSQPLRQGASSSSSKMRRVNGRWVASDDLDVALASSSVYDQAMRRLHESSPFHSPKRSVMWVALDYLIERDTGAKKYWAIPEDCEKSEAERSLDSLGKYADTSAAKSALDELRETSAQKRLLACSQAVAEQWQPGPAHHHVRAFTSVAIRPTAPIKKAPPLAAKPKAAPAPKPKSPERKAELVAKRLSFMGGFNTARTDRTQSTNYGDSSTGTILSTRQMAGVVGVRYSGGKSTVRYVSQFMVTPGSTLQYRSGVIGLYPVGIGLGGGSDAVDVEGYLMGGLGTGATIHPALEAGLSLRAGSNLKDRWPGSGGDWHFIIDVAGRTVYRENDLEAGVQSVLLPPIVRLGFGHHW